MTINVNYGSLNSMTMLGQADWDSKSLLDKTASTVEAAVVDTGVSMWNSVANVATLGNYDDIQTRNILQDLNADGAISAYDNNRDAVELLSFVGGVFIPGGAALKLTKGIRAGLKGTNFLSPMRHKDDLLKLESLVKNAQSHTAEFTQLKRNMFLRGQAENMLDNVAAEVAILGTMNAHPFMEDYLDDPVKNFGISIALGAGVGGAVSGILSRIETQGVIAGVEKAAQGAVTDAANMYQVAYSDSVSSIIGYDLAEKNLRNLAKSPNADPFTQELAKSTADKLLSNRQEIIGQSTSQEILDLPDDMRRAIQGNLLRPEFLGATKIDFFKPAKDKMTAVGKLGQFIESTKNAIFKTTAEDGSLEFTKKVFYNPEVGGFVNWSEANSLSNAAERTTLEGVNRAAKKELSVKQLNSNFDHLVVSGDAGAMEVEYLKHLSFYNGLPSADLLGAEILEKDLAALNGWAGAVRERLASVKGQEALLKPEDFKTTDAYMKAVDKLSNEKLALENASIKVVQGDRVKLVDLTEVTDLPVAGLDPIELVKPTYFDDLNKEMNSGGIRSLVSKDWAGSPGNQYNASSIISHEFYQFLSKETGVSMTSDMLQHIAPKRVEELSKEFVKTDTWKTRSAGMVDSDANVGEVTKLLLARWIGGNFADKEVFRNAVSSARTLRAGEHSTIPYHENLTEIINSPITKASKEALKRHANAKGEMFIYRGTSVKPSGDTAVSSYTLNPKIASGFGTPHLYKVNADDVLAYLYHGEQEWLIGSSTRDALEVSREASKAEHLQQATSKFGQAADGRRISYAKTPTIQMNAVQVQRHVATEFMTRYADEVAKGVPQEVAAMRYNINPEIAPVLSSPTAVNALKGSEAIGAAPIVRWDSPSKLPDALSPTRRQLAVTARKDQHMDKAGELLDKQRQYLKDIGAAHTAESMIGPTPDRVMRGASQSDVARKLGLDAGASQIEIMAALKQQNYASYSYIGGTGKRYTVSLAMSPEEKGILERMVDTEGGQRLLTKINIQDKVVDDIHKQFLDVSVMASKSTLAKELYAKVYDSELNKVLREGLKEFVNPNAGNPMFQSADFITSKMGNVGKVVTALGDLRVETTNKIFQDLVVPVTNQLKKLNTDVVARTEFALFDNMRQSTAGFLRFDAEQATFVRAPAGATFDRATGKFYKIEKDAKGNRVKVAVQGEPISESTVTNASVIEALSAIQNAGDEMYEMQVTLNRVSGRQAPGDIGFWLPSPVYMDRHRSYVMDLDTNKIKMLVGNTAEELKSLEQDYLKQPNQVIRPAAELDAMLKGDFEDGLETVRFADVERQKKGIGLVVPDTDPQRMADIIDRMRARINAQSTGFIESSMHDVITKLDAMSYVNQLHTAKQGSKGYMQAVKQIEAKDTARDIRAILTGNTQIGQSKVMSFVNSAASTTIHYAAQAVSKAWSLVEPKLPGQKVDYEKYSQLLRSSGIPNPYDAFHEAARPLIYERATLSIGNLSPDRIVRAGNEFAATMALKFMELAQPLVNMLSLPILMTSAVSRAIKVDGIQTSGQLMSNGPLAIMMSGIRRMNSNAPQNTRLIKLAEEAGLLNPVISEADAVIKQSLFATGGAIGKIERALDSSFVKMMSKPSEFGEGLVRKAAFMTGVETAYRVYGPTLSDKQVMIFARDFLKQAVGNYSTAQRPLMFQGTAGAAMGLFQTYMLTYAQSMYRHLEVGDYKGLGKTMLAQAGIFGTGSLPGFKQVSQLIGEHYSDDNIDFTTGLYRALPDEMSDVIMYGLPSAIGPALHTRGDVNPRIPTGFTSMVAPSMIAQMTQSMVDVGKAILVQDRPAGQAFMEALSTQSVSRPIARLSELLTGTSVTGQGNQIAGPEEVWSWQGVLSRAFSTRTLAEAKTREAIHLNSYYGAINSDSRQAVLETLRANIRNDSLDSDVLDNLAFEYMRTGSPQGFRQAVNQALMENQQGKIIDLHAKLGDSPLMYMLDDIE